MRFYDPQECEDWLSNHHRQKPDDIPDVHREQIFYPPQSYRIRHFAHWTATSLTDRMTTLLWITEWGIWSPSENWHLYYKLRQTYGDYRLLHEAPGHLFLEHEAEDLASFLQLAILNGWGGYVLTQANRVNAFFSHDGYIAYFAEDPKNLDGLRKALLGADTTE